MLTAHLLRSPGHRTDRFALPGNGMHHDRGGWIAVETPANRHYWFGHRLLMPGPPWAEGIATWRGRWLAENPDPQNRPPRGYLCWESVERDQASLDRAADEEIALEEHVVRVHRGPVPELAAAVLADGAGLEVRPIAGDAEWAECTGITGRAFDDPVDFHAWAQGNRRARVEAGGGVEWGAFVDGRLVGHCGLIWGEGEARFQDVAIDPKFQGRRIGAQLLAAALGDHFARHPGAPAWIVAESESHADRLYAAVGFGVATWAYELSLPITARSR
jgi:ribosomal protein S18 acetylase RimI-like enzyme